MHTGARVFWYPHHILTIYQVIYPGLGCHKSSVDPVICCVGLLPSWPSSIGGVIPLFVVPHTNLTGGTFNTLIGFPASIISFLNVNTDGCSLPLLPTSVECDSKYKYVDSFYLFFFTKSLLPCYIMTACQISKSYFLSDTI